MERYSCLRFTTIKEDEKFRHSKKLALTVGIKSAKHDWVLLTDADCKAVSKDWIATMASNFLSPNDVVLGYGGYMPTKGLLNRIIRFDAFFIAVQYLGFALMGKPYMGVGRNLAYRKELFFQNKGFASHNFLRSGDDDLFVQQIAQKGNTAIEIRHTAHTISNVHTTLLGWINQKRRHITTSSYYRNGVRFWIGLEPLTRVAFWLTAILLLLNFYFPLIIGSILAFRIIVMHIILKISMKRLNERKIFIISLVYDLLSPIFYFSLMVANRLTLNQGRWK
jgi:poly-beta-1,6-N-acetyl-D-glucosamine synthase